MGKVTPTPASGNSLMARAVSHAALSHCRTTWIPGLCLPKFSSRAGGQTDYPGQGVPTAATLGAKCLCRLCSTHPSLAPVLALEHRPLSTAVQ